YSEERWDNWLDRLREEDLDPEEEESARLLLNLQDDVAIAIAKILNAYEEDEIDQEETLEEIEDIREVVLSEPDIEDEDLTMLVDGVQTSLMSVFYSAEQYVAEGVANETTAEEYISAAAEAETEEEFDRALCLVACASTQIIDGEELDMSIADDIEYGYVTEWINGLDSLQSALSEPEVIEEEEKEEET
ncbi:MAG: DUF2150 family protein, partial [Halobacteriaceae archaeon]